MEDELLDEELSYSFASMQIQKKILNKWNKLKKMLISDNEDLNKQIKDFDDLLNYFY